MVSAADQNENENFEEESRDPEAETATIMRLVSCPECGSGRYYLAGKRYLSDGSEAQRYLCRNCGYRFSLKPQDSNPQPMEKPLQKSSQGQGPQRIMQKCLERVGVPLKVVWAPKFDGGRHGEVSGGCLFIYDAEEPDAWDTLLHETVEYRLKAVTQVYRVLVNQLIEGFEKLAYQQKEQFIEALPRIFETVEAERLSPATNSRVKKHKET